MATASYLRAAVVGLGWWGQQIVVSLADSAALRPDLGVDPTELGRAAGRRLGLRTTADLAEALSDPGIDVVILCSPHAFHSAQIIAAARAGKHVFCEKPLCTTADEARAAIAAITEAGVQIGVGHERRFEPPVLDLRRRLSAGEFGEILLLEGNFSQDKFLTLLPDNWRLSPTDAPVGPLSATGIHLVDLSVAVLGTPTEVWARLATRGSDFANGDTLTITLGFDGGATALIGAVLATPFIGRLMVLGSTGWVEIRDRSHPEQPRGWDVTTVHRGEEPVTAFVPPHPVVRDNLEAFAAAVRAGGGYPIPQAEMTATVRTFEAITRSVSSGRIEAI